MKQILKRLELIKTSIAIEDKEIIDLQVTKLNTLDIDNNVRQILADIHKNHYGKVALDIDNYILKYNGLVDYQDKEVEGLKFELKALENKVQELSSKKNEYLHDIESFNTLYQLRLGEIIQKVLEARKELLQKIADDEQDCLKKENADHQYKEAKKDYEEFRDEYEQTKVEQKDVCEINEDEQQELRNLWKEGAKICHPDIVADELKEQALEIMQSLNNAYSKKDLNAVREIVHALKSGTGFTVASDSIDDKEILKAKIKDFRDKISVLEQDIASIKENEIYQTINGITNIDEYLDELKDELEKEYKDLKHNLENVKPSQPPIQPETVNANIEDEEDSEDDFWENEF